MVKGGDMICSSSRSSWVRVLPRSTFGADDFDFAKLRALPEDLSAERYWQRAGEVGLDGQGRRHDLQQLEVELGESPAPIDAEVGCAAGGAIRDFAIEREHGATRGASGDDNLRRPEAEIKSFRLRRRGGHGLGFSHYR